MDNNMTMTGTDADSYQSTYTFGGVEHVLDFYTSPMLSMGNHRHSIDWTIPADNGIRQNAQAHAHAHHRSQSFAGPDLLPLLMNQHNLGPLSRQNTQDTSVTPETQRQKFIPPQLRHGDSSSSISTGDFTVQGDDPTDQENRERRRLQNRNAQRLYRKRKEQSVHDREKEIGDLREQLEHERSVNRSLSKVIDCLRMSLTTGVTLPSGIADLNPSDWSKNVGPLNLDDEDC